ncbi:hypothetical protein DTO169E5_8874 [Paecilomyces variotii]|nr:hypothetical protein DTO169E5_8874 [Paecilomyces variotii]
MSEKAAKCPFCPYDSTYDKTSLREHLSQYTATCRIPADGVHDVLQIQEMLHPGFKHWRQYRCPACSKVINSRRRFIEHVSKLNHYGRYGGRTRRRYHDDEDEEHPWPLPFKKKDVAIPKWTGVFDFLRLPYDIRYIIYKYVLFFGDIMLEQRKPAEIVRPTRRDGKHIWLQYNPCWNSLSLLAVNRQLYDEGRQVFYALNSFVFVKTDDIPIFLLGIGRGNAELLQSVQWKNKEGRYENQIDVIRSCLTRAGGADKVLEEVPDIWNDDDIFENLLYVLRVTDPPFPCLMRLDAKDKPKKPPYRKRYILDFVFKNVDNGFSWKSDRDGAVWFEFYQRWGKCI